MKFLVIGRKGTVSVAILHQKPIIITILIIILLIILLANITILRK